MQGGTTSGLVVDGELAVFDYRLRNADLWPRVQDAKFSIAASTYYDHLAKRADPSRLSDRARQDETLRPEILRVFEENWRV